MPDIMETETLIAEFDRARERLAAAPIIDQKLEFVNNIYPLLKLIVQSHGTRLDQTEGALGELIQGTESMIQPDDAARIQGTIALGIELATAVLARTDREVQADGDEEKLIALARGYHEAATITAQIVEEFTIYEDDDEDDEDNEPIEPIEPEIPSADEPITVDSDVVEVEEVAL